MLTALEQLATEDANVAPVCPRESTPTAGTRLRRWFDSFIPTIGQSTPGRPPAPCVPGNSGVFLQRCTSTSSRFSFFSCSTKITTRPADGQSRAVRCQFSMIHSRPTPNLQAYLHSCPRVCTVEFDWRWLLLSVVSCVRGSGRLFFTAHNFSGPRRRVCCVCACVLWWCVVLVCTVAALPSSPAWLVGSPISSKQHQQKQSHQLLIM